MSYIIVKFKPVGQKALITAINQLQAAQGKATKGGRKFSDQTGRLRGSMGMFQNSLATVRSKMLLYNFAMAMGIKQTIEFAKQAAKVADMSRAFTTLSGTGENAALAVSKISRAVKGTMSEMDLFKQSNNAMILGVTRNTDEMAEMFKIAQTLGAALGVDTPNAVESLITGIGRQSRLMLDNIGIIVKADEAYKDYADRLDKTVDQLTDAEKKQAFFTAAMESARTKAAELGNQQLTARDQFNKFNATMSDFTNFIGEKTSPIVLSFFNSFGEILQRLTETDLETTIRQLSEVGVATERLAELNKLVGMQEAAEELEKSKANITSLLGDIVPIEGIDKIKSFGAGVEYITEVSAFAVGAMQGMTTTSLQFFDVQNLNAEAIDKAYKGVMKDLDDIAVRLKTDPNNEFLLQQKDILVDLAIAYNAILIEMGLVDQANTLLTSSTHAVGVSVEGSGNKIEKTTQKLRTFQQATVGNLQAMGSIANSFGQLAELNGKSQREVAAYQYLGAIANTAAAAAQVLADPKLGFAGKTLAMASVLASGAVQIATINKALKQMGGSGGGGGEGPKLLSFEEGGYVGGRRHSQGGTIIEAERGEFVMSRNAVESIGLETLNQMNQTGGGGSINVSVTGNVLTQDFVEGELAESIKEAIRRGSDFGIG